MPRSFPSLVVALTAIALGGCGASWFLGEEREAWRGQAEARCLASAKVRENEFLRQRAELDGPGVCGADKPFMVGGLADGTMGVTPAATLACPMVSALDDWTASVLQPAAQTHLGQPIAGIRTLGSYGCRSRNNIPGARLSEHAFANALDIAAFRLADGREVTVKSGWRGAPEEQAFLREIHAGACSRFTTVLGPGADVFHYDHFHVDLARHDARGRYRSCKPRPQPPGPAIAGSPLGPGLSPIPAFAPVEDDPRLDVTGSTTKPGRGTAE